MTKSEENTTIYTIGHSTRSIEAFIALLREAAISCLVDVRSVPRSRTNPQFNADALPAALAAAGIAYRHLGALGGLRGRRRGAAQSPNLLWQNASFRNYADYAMGDTFRAGLDALRRLAEDQRCVIMCSEAVWWRCHRRIIADYLMSKGIGVAHIMAPRKIVPASLTPGARAQPDGSLLYAAPAAERR